MLPILYDKTGKNQIGVLVDTIECFVTEERNGNFELNMIYPSTSNILNDLINGNIIVADANDISKNQKFRIYNTRKMMSNRVEICARHISFDLANDYIESLAIEEQSCEYALNMIFRNSQYSQHYRGYSDIVMTQNFNHSKQNCLNAIVGTSGSIIDTFGNGAEILRDNTDIYVFNARGSDNGVSIEYRKNLTGLTLEEYTDDLVTRIRPFAKLKNGEGEEIELLGNFVDSPYINNYSHPYIAYIDYSDKFDDENPPTVDLLTQLAEKEYSVNKVDIIKSNYKIEFIPLSKCAGYEGLEDKIDLCDIVYIKDTRYNIDTQAKVIKVVFNVLKGRYDSMELGDPKTKLGDVITTGALKGEKGDKGEKGEPGRDGSIGNFPDTLPETPTITYKLYGFSSIELTWTFENEVFYSYELYASKIENFVPNTFNLIFSGQASTFLHQVDPEETWYYRVCGLNTYGNRTTFSEQVTVSTVKIGDLSNYVEEMAISDALIGTLSLDRGWVGQLHGNWIDARQLSVTDGNGVRTLDIDSFGNVNLNVASLKIYSDSVITNENLNSTLGSYPTRTEMSSAITQTATEISSTISRQEVQNMEIGGTNLLGSHIHIFGLHNIHYFVRTNTTSFDAVGHGDNDGTVWISNIIDGNGWYTISFDVKCQYDGWNVDVDFCHGETKRFNHISTTDYTHCVYSYEVTNYTSDVYHFIEICGLSSQTFWFKNIKVERGKIATDYSPCPSDYSTTTEMNSAITQKADEINLSVSQTINNIQTGGKNIIKNGNFEDELNHWVFERFSGSDLAGVAVWTGNQNDYRDEWCMDGKKQCVLYVHGIDDSNRRGEWTVRQSFKTVVGQEYTISYMIAGHRSNKTVAVMENINWDHLGTKYYGDLSGGKNANDWVYDSITFIATTPETMIWFIMSEVIYGADGHMWFTDVCCVEGNKAQRFIPSLEEYSTTTQMNSAIQLKVDSITSTVNANYTTLNNKFNDYPTTTQMNSAINQKADSITSTVNANYTTLNNKFGNYSTTAQMNSAINQKADSITSSVSSTYATKSTTNGLGTRLSTAESTISQHTNQIATKVDVNGVKSTIQQNPESVRIGFNGISDYFDLTSVRLKVGHTDGSYTEIGQNGVMYYAAGTGNRYHNLMKQGWLGQISGTAWSRTITLPNEFKGKTFSVIVSITEVNAVNTHDVLKHFQVTVPHNTVNYSNATFVINASALAYWVPGQGSATSILMDVSWIAIA